MTSVVIALDQAEEKHSPHPTLREEFHTALDEWFDSNEQDLEEHWRPTSASDLLETERFLFKGILAFGGLLMALILNTISTNEAFQHECNRMFRQQNEGQWKSQNARPVQVQTRFGNWVAVRTSHLYPKSGRRGKGKRKGFAPFLMQMGLALFVTPFLASEMAREVTEGPSLAAAAGRFVRQGFRISKQRLKRITQEFAQRCADLIKGMLAGEEESFIPSAAGMLVTISDDGGRTKLSRKKRGRWKKGAKRAGRHTEWREPKLILIKLVDPITGEIQKVIDATLNNWHATFRLLESYLLAMEIHLAAEIQYISDGARHLWQGAEAMFERLGVRERVHFTLDFYHASQRIWAISDLIKSWENEKARKRWARMMVGYLRKGKIDRVIGAVEQFCRGRNAGRIKKQLNYLIKHRDHVNYGELEEKGLALGSGEVESAIRQVVNLRMKGNSIQWTREMAEGLLTLRSYLKAGWWESLEKSVAKRDMLWSG